jgi:peptidylprolyl isomerase
METNMIENGKFVQVHYTGTLNDGQTFDSSEGREPLEFEIGSASVIPAFEETVKGMQIEDEKEIAITAKDAYGEYNNELIQTIQLEEIKKFMEPTEGSTIQVQLTNGQHAPALIKTVTDTNVELDFNHPLAGKDLSFKLKLIAINDSATQAAHSHEGEGCGCGDNCGSEDSSCENNCSDK